MFCPCPVLTALQAAWQGKELIHCLLRVRQHRSTGGTSTSDSLSLDLFFNRVFWWWNHSPNTLDFMRLCSLGNNPTVLISMMSPVLSRILENYPTSDSYSLTLWQYLGQNQLFRNNPNVTDTYHKFQMFSPTACLATQSPWDDENHIGSLSNLRFVLRCDSLECRTDNFITLCSLCSFQPPCPGCQTVRAERRLSVFISVLLSSGNDWFIPKIPYLFNFFKSWRLCSCRSANS